MNGTGILFFSDYEEALESKKKNSFKTIENKNSNCEAAGHIEGNGDSVVRRRGGQANLAGESSQSTSGKRKPIFNKTFVNENLHGQYLHMMADTLGSVGKPPPPPKHSSQLNF